MPEVTRYAAGEFCWIELGTSDVEAATAYYTTLFGWTIEDQPTSEGGAYRTCRTEGKKVLGLYELADGPPISDATGWNSYVSVDEVDHSAKVAETLGGSVLVAPVDVADQGRMAVIQDPTGARVGLWEPKETFGAELTNYPGSLTWVELQTKNADAARSFYTELFGWESETQDMGGGTIHTSFKSGEGYMGGCVEMPASEDAAPEWLVYLEAEDVEGLVAKSEEMGGATLVPAQDVPDVGRFAILLDPQGASFGVLKSAPGT
jgi:uncharacterized protein